MVAIIPTILHDLVLEIAVAFVSCTIIYRISYHLEEYVYSIAIGIPSAGFLYLLYEKLLYEYKSFRPDDYFDTDEKIFAEYDETLSDHDDEENQYWVSGSIAKHKPGASLGENSSLAGIANHKSNAADIPFVDNTKVYPVYHEFKPRRFENESLQDPSEVLSVVNDLSLQEFNFNFGYLSPKVDADSDSEIYSDSLPVREISRYQESKPYIRSENHSNHSHNSRRSHSRHRSKTSSPEHNVRQRSPSQHSRRSHRSTRTSRGMDVFDKSDVSSSKDKEMVGDEFDHEGFRDDKSDLSTIERDERHHHRRHGHRHHDNRHRRHRHRYRHKEDYRHRRDDIFDENSSTRELRYIAEVIDGGPGRSRSQLNGHNLRADAIEEVKKAAFDDI